MKTSQIISLALTSLGAAIILTSIIKSFEIRNFNLKGLSGKWRFAVILMFFLLSGHIIFLLSLFLKMDFDLEMATGSAFLLSSCFIYILTTFTKTNINLFRHEISLIKDDNEMKLKTLALKDDLTGLYNRKGFFTLMGPHITLAKREKKNIAILYADIDSLKNINDTLGHQEGDLLLIETANITRATFRKSDIIARVGDDEFAVFLVGAGAHDIESIKNNFEKNVLHHNLKKIQKYKLSLTYGISIYDPGFNDSIDSLMDHAYESMLENKKQKAQTINN